MKKGKASMLLEQIQTNMGFNGNTNYMLSPFFGLFSIFMYVTAMINYSKNKNRATDAGDVAFAIFFWVGLVFSIAGCVCCCCLACPCCLPDKDKTLSTSNNN